MAPQGRKPQAWEEQRGYKWGARKYKPTTGLDLTELVILRRIRAGESQANISRALGYARGSVHHQIAGAVRRYGVENCDELLALPEVQALLDKED